MQPNEYNTTLWLRIEYIQIKIQKKKWQFQIEACERKKQLNTRNKIAYCENHKEQCVGGNTPSLPHLI